MCDDSTYEELQRRMEEDMYRDEEDENTRIYPDDEIDTEEFDVNPNDISEVS